MSPDVARYSVLCGLCALIPLPWVDEWAERQARRKLYGAVAAAHAAPLDEPALDVLTEDRSSLVLGCLWAVVRWPVKKLFRTIIYVLTLKDAVDGVALAAHRAAMLHAAFAAGHLPRDAAGVRAEMDLTLGRVQWSPISRWLMRGSRPPSDWLPVEDPITPVIAALHRHGGGGLLLADFAARLEKRA